MTMVGMQGDVNVPVTYTVLHMFMQVLFWAGNQGDHQNFNPSLLPKKLWLIFMGVKQKKILHFFSQNGRLKKTDFFKTTHSQWKAYKNSSATSEYIWPNCVVYCFFAKKTKQETSVTIGTFFLKNESTFLERPSLFSLTNFQFSSQNKLIDMHCESSQKYFIEHLDICKKIKSNARFIKLVLHRWSTNS